MKNAFLLLIVLFVLTGCTTPVPFDEPSFEPLTSVSDAEDALFHLQSAIPRTVAGECGIVIEYKGVRMTVYALIKADQRTGTLALVVMTPAGQKLFEAVGTASKLQYYRWFPEIPWKNFGKKEAQIVINTFSSICFEQVPPAKTPVLLENGKWVLNVNGPDGSVLHYKFAGKPVAPAEKFCTKGRRMLWKMKIYSYIPVDRTVVPGKLVFEDYVRDFRLIFRVRRVQALP